MNKSIVIILCILFAAVISQAQTAERSIYSINEKTSYDPDKDDIINGVWPKDNRDRLAVRYPYLREADVMWSRTVWRKLDMREKMNHPIYYPLEATRERVSLVQLMLGAVNEGSLTAYDPMNDEFTTPLPWSSMKGFGSRWDSVLVPDPDNPDKEVYKTYEIRFDPATVKEFRIKEVWFFDKQRSQMDVRIVGICPVAENIDPTTGEVRGMSPMFWVYFPELRNMLASTRVFTRFNGNMEMSYDDLFWKRMFSSYIYKVQNVYDRKIADYTTGINSMLESEKVKDEIFFMETDLWEY